MNTWRATNEVAFIHIDTLRGELPDGSTARGCDARYAVPGKDAASPPFTPVTYENPVPCAVSVVPPSADVVVPSNWNERISPAVETTVGATLVLAVKERLRDTVLVVVAAAVLAGVPDAVADSAAVSVGVEVKLRDIVLETVAAAVLEAVPDGVAVDDKVETGVALEVDVDDKLRETVLELVAAVVSVGVPDAVREAVTVAADERLCVIVLDFVAAGVPAADGVTARAATSAEESARS